MGGGLEGSEIGSDESLRKYMVSMVQNTIKSRNDVMIVADNGRMECEDGGRILTNFAKRASTDRSC